MHKSHSRLEDFLISKDLVEGTVDFTIGPTALTDHATVQWGVKLGSDVIKSNRWRMNVSLLQDETFANILGEDLKMFFDISIGSTERLGSVWEASKAYIRGKIIAHSSKKKKDSKERMLGLESQLKDAEKELAGNHTEDHLRKVCELKFQLNELYSKNRIFSNYSFIQVKICYSQLFTLPLYLYIDLIIGVRQ